MSGYRGQDLAYLKIGAVGLEKVKGDLTFSVTNGTIDTRDNDSAGYEEKIIGDQAITISGSFNYQLESDSAPAQLALMTAGLGNVEIPLVEWGFEDKAGAKKWTAGASVSDMSPAGGDPQVVSFTLTILEKPTAGVQS